MFTHTCMHMLRNAMVTKIPMLLKLTRWCLLSLIFFVVFSTSLKAESSVTTNLLLFTMPSPSCPSSCPSCPSCLSSCPSLSPPSSQSQSSVLGYSTALGVVSVLLIISLVGHLTTVVVCVLVRKARHSSADMRKWVSWFYRNTDYLANYILF